MRLVVCVFGIIILGIGILMINMYPHYAGAKMLWFGFAVSIAGVLTSAIALASDPDFYL